MIIFLKKKRKERKGKVILHGTVIVIHKHHQYFSVHVSCARTCGMSFTYVISLSPHHKLVAYDCYPHSVFEGTEA